MINVPPETQPLTPQTIPNELHKNQDCDTHPYCKKAWTKWETKINENNLENTTRHWQNVRTILPAYLQDEHTVQYRGKSAFVIQNTHQDYGLANSLVFLSDGSIFVGSPVILEGRATLGLESSEVPVPQTENKNLSVYIVREAIFTDEIKNILTNYAKMNGFVLTSPGIDTP